MDAKNGRLELGEMPNMAAMALPPVTGAPLENDVQRSFTLDMHNAGFIVNWMTFKDGTRTPSVYGNMWRIRKATNMELGFRSFGDNTVAWPCGTCGT